MGRVLLCVQRLDTGVCRQLRSHDLRRDTMKRIVILSIALIAGVMTSALLAYSTRFTGRALEQAQSGSAHLERLARAGGSFIGVVSTDEGEPISLEQLAS